MKNKNELIEKNELKNYIIDWKLFSYNDPL